MGYIDENFYNGVYIGEPVNTAEFPRFLTRATEVIDNITRYVVAQKGLAAFDSFTQLQFKKAVAAQLEFYAFEGIDTANQGNAQMGFTVGRVSVSGSADDGTKSTVCPKAYQTLEPTGLLYRGALC